MKTPYYLINEAKLEADWLSLRSAMEEGWGEHTQIGWSLKTNSLPWLVSWFREKGALAEVVSETEAALASRIGFPFGSMIYNGPIKDSDLFFRVLSAGGYVNLDSHDELDWLGEEAGSFSFPVSVGIRVNLSLPGEEPSRFGFSEESGELAAVIDRLRYYPQVRITGLHMHRSTQKRLVSTYQALAEGAARIAEKYRLSLSYVDIGGGFYGGGKNGPSFAEYFGAIGEALKKTFSPEKTCLIAEPGISLCSGGFTFHTTVLDVREAEGIRFLVTNGSRMNLNPQVTRHSYPHHLEFSGSENMRENIPLQWVTGFTCMEYDKLFPLEDSPALYPGDKVIYETAGGYTMALNPLFIRYLPEVHVLKKDGKTIRVREAWGAEEYLQKNVWIPAEA